MLQVVASLIYADSGEAVEKSGDEEAPLLASYDGVEFASSDRPSKLLHGRASFKLKISQVDMQTQDKSEDICLHNFSIQILEQLIFIQQNYIITMKFSLEFFSRT